MDWNEAVKLIRRRLGLKQAALAEMAGVAQSAISRWESGLVQPNLGAQRMLRDLLVRSEMASSRLGQLKAQVRASESLVLLNENAGFEEVSEKLCGAFRRDRSDVVGRRNDEHMLDEGDAAVAVCDLFSKSRDALLAKIYNGGFSSNGEIAYVVTDALPVYPALDSPYVLYHSSFISKDEFDAALSAHGGNYVVHHLDDLAS